MKIAITGASGFIGFHLAFFLLKHKYRIVGIDNLNSYYDINLKNNRLKILKSFSNFKFYKIDICNSKKLSDIFQIEKINIIVHLAAQAGVRYSLKNPKKYLMSNVIGFFNILEVCRKYKVSNLYFASTSSVYGKNKLPFSEKQNVNKPIQFYAATKISNEVMAYSYSILYNIRAVGLRFFTVYGPYGRPDMATFSFIKDIFDGRTISIFNQGKHSRDFTYVDDIVLSIFKLIKLDKLKKIKKFDIYNIGNQKKINIIKVVKIIERLVNKKAKIKLTKISTGDMKDTFSNSEKLNKYISYKPNTSIEIGLKNTVKWYISYYKKK